MSEYINDIRPGLDSFLEKRVSEARRHTEKDMSDLEEKITKRDIQTGPQPMLEHTCRLRERSIRRFIQIKNEFNQEILRTVRRSSTVEDLEQLSGMQQREDEVRAKRKQLEAEKEQLKQKIFDASCDKYKEGPEEQRPYDMFVLYSAEAARLSKKTASNTGRNKTAKPGDDGEELERKARESAALNTEQNAAIKAQVANLYQRYIQKKRAFFLLGFLVSLACAVADFSIIQAVLIAANLPRGTAVYSAILSAIVLDVPPYILGYLTMARQDKKRLENEIPGAPEGYAKSYRLSIYLLRIAIILIVLAYVCMRLVMFLGGGNFNLAAHAILAGDWSFQNSKFNSADILSIFIPIATSAVAYGVSFLLSVQETDYVRSAIEYIKDGLVGQKLEVERQISASEAAIKTLSRSIEEKKEAIEATFVGKVQQRDKKSRADEAEGFVPRIIKAYRRQVIPQFLHEYKLCASHLRADAENDLANINPRLLAFASNAQTIANMEYTADEIQLLNEIWSEDEAQQGQATRKTLERLESDIDSLLSIYEKKDSDE